MSIRAVFRCDGDRTRGAGHVGRCLPLARALRAAGAEVVFAGSYEGVAADLLARADVPMMAPQSVPAPDIVIADGYDLRDGDLRDLRRGAPVLRVAAAEPLAPPVLELDYHVRDARHAALSGPAYAPVAPEFVAARRPRAGERWLVTLGGGTAGAGLIDRAVSGAAAAGATDVWVTSADAPVAVQGVTVRHEPAPGGLRDAVAWADVAVSGAGVTAYELACAGLPAALVQVADNQAPVVAGLSHAGTAAVARPATLEDDVRAALGDAGTRQAMAERGPALVDGYGAFRTRDALLGLLRGDAQQEPLFQRPAREQDAELLHAWRNEPGVRAASRDQAAVPLEDHVHWLRGALADPDRTLLVAERAGEPVGTVRFDRRGSESEISLTVAPHVRSAGVGTRLIAETSELELAARPELARIVAVVRPENERSRAAFERAGFTLVRSEAGADALLTLVLDRRPSPH
jgi:UDP-2,4-diacetamido-2,4,6-trideoxy-beta-L-altropyranose hydrolase